MNPRARTAAAGILVLAATAWLGCGAPVKTPRWSEPPAGAFQAAVQVVPAGDGTLRPLVQASVAHGALIFHRDRSGADDFVCRLQVVVTAWRDGTQVGGGVAAAEARLVSPEHRDGRSELAVDVPLQLRGMDPVELRVEARVVGTQRHWSRTLHLEPRTLAAAPLMIHTLELELPSDHELPPDQLLVPLAASVIRLEGAAPWPRDGVMLELRGRGPGGTVLSRRRVPIPTVPEMDGPVPIEVTWPVAELPFGQLELAAELSWRHGDEDLRLPWDRPLELVNLAVPVRQDQVWNDHLDWLDGQRPAAVLDSLRSVPAVGRPAAWRDLWQEAGDEARLTHLRRIVEADRRFSQRRRGASTDRGLVWIRWGQPDDVQRRLDQRNLGGLWEIWTYEAQNQRFFFHDPHGLDEFQLRRTAPAV